MSEKYSSTYGWDDDNPFNRPDCTFGEFAKHFRVCLDEKENA